jgi:hypothetical protein
MNITKKTACARKNGSFVLGNLQRHDVANTPSDTLGRLRRGGYIFISLLSLVAFSFAAGLPIVKKEEADTSKIVVPDEYWKAPEKKTPLFDSTGRQLSARQMVNFIKTEYAKLNQEITDLNSKMFPDSAAASTTDDADVEHLFILKGKIESLEKSLDEWNKRIDPESTTAKDPDPKKPAPETPPTKK